MATIEEFKKAEAARKAKTGFGRKMSGSKIDIKKRDAEFNAKVKKNNEGIYSEEAISKFRKSEADRKARIASKNIVNPNSPKGKRMAADKSQYDVEAGLDKISPKPNFGTTSVKQAVTEAKPAAKASNQGLDKPRNTEKSVASGLSAFGKAFSQARQEGKKEFPFEGAQYAAYTKQEVEKAGKSNLGEYLNSLKRQNTEIAKAPGQMKKGGMVVARGNKIARSKPTKIY
jgi:hypothetical protein